MVNGFDVYGSFAEALCEYIRQDKPFLGICLGLQLLFEGSEEKGNGNLENCSRTALTRSPNWYIF